MKQKLNFSWIIENNLGASSIPDSVEKIKWLISQDIKVIISLTEHNLSRYIKNFRSMKKTLNFKQYHISTIDGSGFFPHQFLKMNKIYRKAQVERERTLIHCMGGYGRTSTALTGIFMMQENLSLEKAIDELKYIRPQFMLTPIQKNSLKVWEKYLQKNKSYK
jgi:protein-tyrosine phosphatase